MRRLLCLLLLAVTAAAQDRPLQVGTKEAPPFAMRRADGTWAGIGVDLWKRVAQDLGLRFEWREAINKAVLRETSTEKWAELLERHLGRQRTLRRRVATAKAARTFGSPALCPVRSVGVRTASPACARGPGRIE